MRNSSGPDLQSRAYMLFAPRLQSTTFKPSLRECGFIVRWALVVAVSTSAGSSATAAVRYVNASRPNDSGDGLSWATADRTLQAALQVAVSGDEIWVAAGTYMCCFSRKWSFPPCGVV